MPPNLRLLVANLNYSTWSMRPWLLMKATGIPFQEVQVLFGDGEKGPTESFKTKVAKEIQTATGGKGAKAGTKVPALIVEHAGEGNRFVVWDSLAIVECLAENFPEKQVWPADPTKRALARSIAAEMHSSFTGLRSNLVGNVSARLPEVGERLLRENAAVRADVDRVIEIWTSCLSSYGGPYLFGDRFCAGDAFFAPVVGRFETYGLRKHLPSLVQSYMDVISTTPAYRELARRAREENAFVPYLEIHRPRSPPSRL